MMMKEQQHPLWLRASADGDREAFGALYHDTRSRLFGVALMMMNSRNLAEDALQEAYIRIWHNAAEYHAERGSVVTWMTSIVRYRCLDMLRAQGTREKYVVAVAEPADEPQAMHTETSTDGTETGFTAENDSMQLCLGELSTQERQTISLVYYQGLSHHEIVAHTDHALGSVKSWIRRGLDKLKRCIQRELSE